LKKTITRGERVFVTGFCGHYMLVFLTKTNSLVTDETLFHLNGRSSAQNNKYWRGINPRQTSQARCFLDQLIFRPWRWRRYVPPKRLLTLNGLHGGISQKSIRPYSPLKVNRRFGETYRLHLQGRRISRARNQREIRWQAELIFRPWKWKRYIPPKRRLTFNPLYIQRYIPKDGTLHNHRCENLKSHIGKLFTRDHCHHYYWWIWGRGVAEAAVLVPREAETSRQESQLQSTTMKTNWSY
jgi:hypothetical protein